MTSTRFNWANGAGGDFRYTVVLIDQSTYPQEVLLDSENINRKSIKAFVTSYAEGRYLQPTSLAPAAKPHIEILPQSVATVSINW